MDKEIKITPPEGYEIDKVNSTFDHIKFKPIEKKNLTWLEIQEKNIGKTQYFIRSVGDVQTNNLDSVSHSASHLPSEYIAKKVIALCQLYIIAEYYNDGWVADWEDDNCIKHYLCFKYGNEPFYTSSRNYSSANPVFKSAEILQTAYEANKEIFETALKQ